MRVMICVLSVVGLVVGQDPLYDFQSWHLHSISGSTGDLDLEPVWEQGFTGAGVTIAYTGSMPALTHEELDGKFNTKVSAITDEGTEDYRTSLVSVAVGTANNMVCSRGVAPNASFAILDSTYGSAINCEWLKKYLPKLAHIYVIDYGGPDGPQYQTSSPGCLQGIQMLFELGAIVITISGDGGDKDNCNNDNYANSPFAISIGYHTKNGDIPSRTEKCACTLVSAPSGDIDKNILIPAATQSPVSCNFFGGSRYAASASAGVVALMLEASNFKATSRDIQHVLVTTATQPRHAKAHKNGAGLRWSNKLGFGMINASAAVARMRSWAYVRDLQVLYERSKVRTLIPDLGSSVSYFEFREPLLVERIGVLLHLQHPSPGDLQISIISPQGTESVLAEPRGEVDSSQYMLTSNIVNKVSVRPLNAAGKDVKAVFASSVTYYTVQEEANCCQFPQCKLTLFKDQEVDNGESQRLLLLPYSECDPATYLFNAMHLRQFAAPQIIVLGIVVFTLFLI